jgi:hypothetical protein
MEMPDHMLQFFLKNKKMSHPDWHSPWCPVVETGWYRAQTSRGTLFNDHLEKTAIACGMIMVFVLCFFATSSAKPIRQKMRRGHIVQTRIDSRLKRRTNRDTHVGFYPLIDVRPTGCKRKTVSLCGKPSTSMVEAEQERGRYRVGDRITFWECVNEPGDPATYETERVEWIRPQKNYPVIFWTIGIGTTLFFYFLSCGSIR